MTTKIVVSQFKSHCLEITEKLKKNGDSIIITKRDKEVNFILPINNNKNNLIIENAKK